MNKKQMIAVLKRIYYYDMDSLKNMDDDWVMIHFNTFIDERFDLCEYHYDMLCADDGWTDCFDGCQVVAARRYINEMLGEMVFKINYELTDFTYKGIRLDILLRDKI